MALSLRLNQFHYRRIPFASRYPLRNKQLACLVWLIARFRKGGYMEIKFNTEDIDTEETFAGYFFMLVKIGENLLQQVPSKTLQDLVLSLKTVKRHYIATTESGDV